MCVSVPTKTKLVNSLPKTFGTRALNVGDNFMKTLVYVSIFLFLSCNNNVTQKENVKRHDSVTAKTVIRDSAILLPKLKIDRTKYHTTKDTVYIYSQTKDTLRYSKNEFNDIVDNFPELYESPVRNPDTTYSISMVWVDLVDSLRNRNHLTFGSEAGQDEYYILYAYFLKHKNGIAKYSVRRKKLLEIYNTLNDLFGMLNYGGTYYGHQYSRIEGYAEFSVYWFRHYEDWFDRPYDITKQRKFYIAGLKQLILNEEKIDNITTGKKEKAERRKELFDNADKLNKLITDNFYLRMAQSFQSDNY